MSANDTSKLMQLILTDSLDSDSYNCVQGELLEMLIGNLLKDSDIDLKDFVLVPKEKIMADKKHCCELEEQNSKLQQDNIDLQNEIDRMKENLAGLEEDNKKLLQRVNEVDEATKEISSNHQSNPKLQVLDPQLGIIKDLLKEILEANKDTHERLDEGLPKIIDGNNDLIEQGNSIVQALTEHAQDRATTINQTVQSANELFAAVKNYIDKSNAQMTKDLTKQISRSSGPSQATFN